MYKNVLFDLDGTLTNPSEGISNGFIYALDKYNIKVSEKEKLYSFIGPPLFDTFKSIGFTDEIAVEAIAHFRKYYDEVGKLENEVYENIKVMLETLKSRGYKLAVATSKPTLFSVEILKHFGLDQYFDFISGATFDGTLIQKGDIIKVALDKLGLNPSETIMIGDRKHDVLGAKEHGLDSIGVLYGFGNREELVETGATFIVKEVLDILDILK